jgi:hypothetical protein
LGVSQVELVNAAMTVGGTVRQIVWRDGSLSC